MLATIIVHHNEHDSAFTRFVSIISPIASNKDFSAAQDRPTTPTTYQSCGPRSLTPVVRD